MKVQRFGLWLAVCFCLLVVLLAVKPVSAAMGLQGNNPEPINIPKLTADLLFSLAGAAVSILAWVIPPFRRGQQSLGDWTPAFMIGVLGVLAVGYQFVWCQYNLLCLRDGWQTTVLIWGTCVAANYATYKGYVKPAKDKLKAATAFYSRF